MNTVTDGIILTNDGNMKFLHDPMVKKKRVSSEYSAFDIY